MNANPSTCPHHSLTYDGTFAIVRCMDCDTIWDADQPILDPYHSATLATRAQRSGEEHSAQLSSERCPTVSYDHGDEHDTYENHPEWLEDDDPPVTTTLPPYPMCRTPTLCAGKGYCPHDIACNN